jgi:hypothetical protein
MAKNGFRYPFPQYGIEQDPATAWQRVILRASRCQCLADLLANCSLEHLQEALHQYI